MMFVSFFFYMNPLFRTIIHMDANVYIFVMLVSLNCTYNPIFKNHSSEHAERFGYGVVERFVGHGVGTVFHSEPIILHNRKYILFVCFICSSKIWHLIFVVILLAL